MGQEIPLPTTEMVRCSSQAWPKKQQCYFLSNELLCASSFQDSLATDRYLKALYLDWGSI